MKTRKRCSALFALVVSFVAISGGCSKVPGKVAVSYVEAAIGRGAIEKTVSGSGSLEPVSSVKVLAQMSGIAERVYADYNDHVRKGQVLVELNTDMLRLQRVEKLASVSKARAQYDLQLSQYSTQLKLAEKKLVSDYELQTSKTTLDMYSAELKSAEAGLSVIDTEISQYAIIKAPITGVVLERNVESGASVVEGSSSNSSSLFTIAEDLNQMQIEAQVDEVDIASISKGQSVRFSVEALPDESFSGKVRMIRLTPETTDNVVSYSVVIDVDNSEGALLPGMTAEVDFIVERKEDVFLVPNAALRYEPSSLTAEEISLLAFEAGLEGLSGEDLAKAREKAPVPGDRGQGNGSPAAGGSSTGKRAGLSSLVMGGGPRGPRTPGISGQKRNGASAAAGNGGDSRKNLWYLDGSGKPAVVKVLPGISDGTNTAVTSTHDLEGMRIIVREGIN